MSSAKNIAVLIVDDSSLARDFVKAILATDGNISVAGEASNGQEAIEMVRETKPDIVLMDIEMPIMNGIEAIEKIMAYNAVPILVITSKGDADLAYRAISKGALEVMPKSELDPDAPWKFIEHIQLLSRVRVVTHVSGKDRSASPKSEEKKEPFDHIIAIAASTGGPKALNVILPELPKEFECPVVVAQHIADGFIHGMVNWLNQISKINVKIAEPGETLVPGNVYISPPERHMVVNYGDRVSFIERKPNDIYHPSCDVMLNSVASVYGPKAIGVILTGMGSDGVRGMQKIKDAKGITIAQNEDTSIVFGMPRLAIESGCVDRILPLDKIGTELLRLGSKK